MDVIANNLPQFDGDISEYESFRTGLQNSFNELVANIEQLNTMWEGEAHEQFKATFTTDRQKSEKMLEDVLRVENELKFAHSEYTTCENNVANIIAEL